MVSGGWTMLAAAVAAATAAQTPPAAGLSEAAFAERQAQRLMAADSDGDGRLSPAELEAAGRGRGDPARRFARLDANGDGFVDRAELAARSRQAFARLDADHDGVLTPRERMAARAAVRAATPGGQ